MTLGERRRLVVVGVAMAVAIAAVALFSRGHRSTPAPVLRDASVYRGLGAWIDTYDYVVTYAGPNPSITVESIDALAAKGVRTIYLQAARNDAKTPGGIIDATLLAKLLKRAHDRSMRVVGWSTPWFVDVQFDYDRIVGIARFVHDGQRFDGVAVDIEDNQEEPDPTVRSARLVELSKRVRTDLGPSIAVGAIVLPTVLIEDVNPGYWPAFPWTDIKPYYDIWMPMTYWSGRTAESGWHDGYRYTTETITRMRVRLADPQALVHPIGGIADKITMDETAGFVRAITDTGSIGGSLYDTATTGADLWPALAPLGVRA